VLKDGDSIDVKCADLALRYEHYMNEKMREEEGGQKSVEPSPTEMQAMIDSVRNKRHKDEGST